MSALEDLSSAAAACLGTEVVPDSLASQLRAKLPYATFLRVSLRCGSVLFMTATNLLRPGPVVLTVVSLQSSMAGVAMKEGRPVWMGLHSRPHADLHLGSVGGAGESGGAKTTSVACFPVSVKPAANSSGESFIGALHVGLSAPLEDSARGELEELCAVLGPYLLLVSLTKLQDMAKIMQLPGAECTCCADEDLVCDAPFGRCLDEDLSPPPPGAGAGASLAGPSAGALRQGAEVAAAAEEEAAGEAARKGAAGELRWRGGGGSHAAAAAASGSPLGDELRGAKGLGLGAAAAAAAAGAAAALEGAGGSEVEQEEEEGDPKAAAKRARAQAQAPRLSQSLLLTFSEPLLEARFRRDQARELVKLDLLFHLVYLVAFLCTAVLDPLSMLRTPTNIWLAWILLLPAATIATCMSWYLRWRAWLVIPLTLLHMAHYRFAAAPALLQALPDSALRKLPWLLRCTGAEALLVFPLGSKMPFSLFLPVQLLSMLLMLTLLPGPCHALLPLLSCNPGCLPAGWGVRCCAALLGAGFVLPTCAVYFAEARARERFAKVLHRAQA